MKNSFSKPIIHQHHHGQSVASNITSIIIRDQTMQQAILWQSQRFKMLSSIQLHLVFILFFLILGFVCFIHSYHVPNLLVSRAPIANSAAFIQSAFQQEPIVGTLTPLSLNPQMPPTPNVISLLSLSHITLNTHLYSKSRRGPHRTLDILTNIHARCAV